MSNRAPEAPTHWPAVAAVTAALWVTAPAAVLGVLLGVAYYRLERRIGSEAA